MHTVVLVIIHSLFVPISLLLLPSGFDFALKKMQI